MRRTLIALAVGLMSAAGVSIVAAAAEPCSAPAEGWSYLPVAMPAHARTDDGLRIVALGSSSTQGVGASSTTMSYPAQLEQVLEQRHPGTEIEVFNRGIGGETVPDNLARLDRDVLALEPTLVIWQAGTNDALRDRRIEVVAAEVAQGIARIRAAGADVALLAPQPLPNAAADAATRRMADALKVVAAVTATPYLDRYSLMQYWRDAKVMAPTDIVGPDGLHMTDASYRCLAVQLAEMVPTITDLPVPSRPGSKDQPTVASAVMPGIVPAAATVTGPAAVR